MYEFQTFADAVERGKRNDAKALTKRLIAASIKPLAIVEHVT